jgi:glycosyltransferase involved in cell wall biosynthesis
MALLAEDPPALTGCLRASGHGIVQIIAGLDSRDGGPFYSVPRLAASVALQANQLVVLSSLQGQETSHHGGSVVRRAFSPDRTPLLDRLASSRALKTALLADARAGALLHTHGLWLMPNIYPAWARQQGHPDCRLVHSPRGMLGAEALKISAWKKKLVWHLWQRAALETADCLHATAASEYEEIRAAGLKNPVAIIPNGMDLPDLAALPRPVRHPDTPRTILSLGRVHPKKALDRLIRAFARLEAENPNWRLRIVGPTERGHDEELRSLCQSLSTRHVSIEGPVYGEAKWRVHRDADLFVLPTLNENFGLSVAEALACEVPVISTKGAPWSGLEREGCGWWIDHGVDPLVDALQHAMALPDTARHAMGARGRTWIARDFGWEGIGRDMLAVYRWLRDGGPPPHMIRQT